ncbi:zinc finger protein ZAT11-like [Daucus carota subsp. sativus]|uniref:zinc finger protein ZAT11-like n=1 Tax=Daucus carota subsp. sativus TaxID=79200 RepID=UPI003082B50C
MAGEKHAIEETKRMKFSNTDPVERFARANCAMILQRAESRKSSSKPEKIFKCKKCERSFSTVQSLGSHRANHKRIERLGGGGTEAEMKGPKPYKCTMCSAEFWNGMALGGHKSSKHYRKRKNQDLLGSDESYGNNASTVAGSAADHSDDVKMVTGNCFDKRMLGLDLNLSPDENEMKVEF